VRQTQGAGQPHSLSLPNKMGREARSTLRWFEYAHHRLAQGERRIGLPHLFSPGKESAILSQWPRALEAWAMSLRARSIEAFLSLPTGIGDATISEAPMLTSNLNLSSTLSSLP